MNRMKIVIAGALLLTASLAAPCRPRPTNEIADCPAEWSKLDPSRYTCKELYVGARAIDWGLPGQEGCGEFPKNACYLRVVYRNDAPCLADGSCLATLLFSGGTGGCDRAFYDVTLGHWADNGFVIGCAQPFTDTDRDASPFDPRSGDSAYYAMQGDWVEEKAKFRDIVDTFLHLPLVTERTDVEGGDDAYTLQGLSFGGHQVLLDAMRSSEGERTPPRPAYRIIYDSGGDQGRREARLACFAFAADCRDGVCADCNGEAILEEVAEAYGGSHAFHIVRMSGVGDRIDRDYDPSEVTHPNDPETMPGRCVEGDLKEAADEEGIAMLERYRRNSVIADDDAPGPQGSGTRYRCDAIVNTARIHFVTASGTNTPQLPPGYAGKATYYSDPTRNEEVRSAQRFFDACGYETSRYDVPLIDPPDIDPDRGYLTNCGHSFATDWRCGGRDACSRVKGETCL